MVKQLFCFALWDMRELAWINYNLDNVAPPCPTNLVSKTLMKHGEHLAWPDQSSENNIQLIRNSHGIENLALSSLTSVYKRTKIQGFRFLKIRAICILNISFTGASHASWQSLTWLHLYFHPRHHHSTSNIIRVILQCIEHFKSDCFYPRSFAA